MAYAEDVRTFVERMNAMGQMILEQQQSAVVAALQLEQLRVREAVGDHSRVPGLVDTKLFGRLMAFDGHETSWWGFKFLFTGYGGAVDAILRESLTLADNHEMTELRNAPLSPEQRALSAQFCYMSIMVCRAGAQKWLGHAGDTAGAVAWRRLLDEYEPRASGWECALLQELLHFNFRATRAVHLGEYEVLLRRYAALSGEEPWESLKVALAQKGISYEAIGTRPVLHVSRLTTFKLVRQEIRIVLITRQALGQTPVPMGIGAVEAKGKGNKSREDKNRNKGNVIDKCGKGEKPKRSVVTVI